MEGLQQVDVPAHDVVGPVVAREQHRRIAGFQLPRDSQHQIVATAVSDQLKLLGCRRSATFRNAHVNLLPRCDTKLARILVALVWVIGVPSALWSLVLNLIMRPPVLQVIIMIDAHETGLFN